MANFLNLKQLEAWRPSHMREGFPVMPGALPGLGHVAAIHVDALGALRRAKAELGPVFWVHLGFGNWYLFCTGGGAFDLLKHPGVVTAGSRGTLKYLLGASLLTLDGASHRQVRSAMNPPFSPRGITETMTGSYVNDVVLARGRRWAQSERVVVHTELKEMALDVVFRIAGVPAPDLPGWRKHYAEVLLGLLPPPWDLPFSPRRRALRATRWINAEIEKLIVQARSSGAGEGMTGALARARDESGQLLEVEVLTDNVRLLFLAGHETTATTTAWAILELARNPALWERLLDEVLRGPGVPLSIADAKAFPLCEAIFRESVRLYGPAWFIERRTTQVIEHADRHIPAGINVGVTPLLWARDAAAFPEPDAFVPDRWLGRPPPSPFETSQFGGGAHFCLGYHLAWLEVVAFLVALGREAAGAGRRHLRLLTRGGIEQRYFPLPHPPAGAAVRFE